MELKAKRSYHKELIYHTKGFGLSPEGIGNEIQSVKDWKQRNYIIQFVFLKDHSVTVSEVVSIANLST